jgi:hypothetical protein
MRVKGHGLQREGRAHDALGNYTGQQVGHALCACGAISDEYDTTAARQAWHVGHKQEMARLLGPSSWSIR